MNQKLLPSEVSNGGGVGVGVGGFDARAAGQDVAAVVRGLHAVALDVVAWRTAEAAIKAQVAARCHADEAALAVVVDLSCTLSEKFPIK